jgi:dolichyl-phosphate-mannose--protein O-mannosyl transferase
MYHMFGGLIFMVLANAFVLAYLAGKLPAPDRKWLAAAHLGIAVLFFGYFYPVWTAVPLSAPAWYESSGTPPWGPKLWLVNCRDLPPSQPQIFCWN